MKEVQKSARRYNLNLYILELLKRGLNPSKICTELHLKKSALQYYLSSLKRLGVIAKIGYGVWEVNEQKEVQNQLTDRYLSPVKNLNLLRPDQVRGHGIQFTLSLPNNLRNWDRRKELLTRAKIKFRDMPNIFGGAELIEFRGKKVILTNKSIIVNEPKDYLTETADKAKSQAIYSFLTFVRGLESYLKANLSYGGQYKFKVTRQHYALVKNALAKQYDSEGKKLEVYSAGELWFVIDNSFNLHEAETIHPATSDTDNKKVQDFFNGLKRYEGFTPQFLMESIGKSVQCSVQNAQNLDNYAIHLKAHVESVVKLGNAVEELVKIVKKSDN
jgi:hypothetical protein